MKASVIIPAYNAEKSINNSLMSLAEQSLTDFEVLVINDGSTDHTTDVVNDFIQYNKGMNIKLVEKENGGVASARNRGLDEAKGKYILFLDADDIYRKDCIECLVSKIERHNTDIVIAGYTRSASKFEKYSEASDKLCDPIEAMYLWMYNVPARVFCSIIYKKEIIDDYSIRFPNKTKYGEDLEFTWEYLRHINRATITNEQIYAYIDTATSAVHKIDWSKTDLLDSTIRIGKMLKEYDAEFGEKYSRYMYPRTVWAVARTFSKAGRFDLLVKMEDKYDTKGSMKILANEIVFHSQKYKGEVAKKIIIVFTSIAYVINSKLFYLLAKRL